MLRYRFVDNISGKSDTVEAHRLEPDRSRDASVAIHPAEASADAEDAPTVIHVALETQP